MKLLKNEKGLKSLISRKIIAIICVLLISALFIGCKAADSETTTVVEDKTGETSEEPVACTEEAKICPDGTAVGRSGPDCEFDPCPEGEGDEPVVEEIIVETEEVVDDAEQVDIGITQEELDELKQDMEDLEAEDLGGLSE